MENQMNVGSQDTQQVGKNTVNQPVLTQEKPTINYLTIGGIILACFVVFGFGGYYLGKQSLNYPQTTSNQQVSASPTAQPTTISEPTTTPVADLTAEWETYTGADYSFKHPKGLKSDTGAAGTGFESIRFQFMGQKQVASGRTQTSLFDGYSFAVTNVVSSK